MTGYQVMIMKFMNKIPAGNFIVPLILSMILFTFFPNLFRIGGVTESFLSADGSGFVIGMLCFASGTTIKLNDLKDLMRYQGSLILVKLVLSLILTVAFLYAFGLEGIWGISGLAFTATIISTNPAVYVALLNAFGREREAGIYPFAGLIALPIVPLIVLSVYVSGGLGGVNWWPVISVFVPLILGMILGNLDEGFTAIFSKCMPALLMMLGWTLGQGMDFIEAMKSGLPGVVMTVFFIIVTLPVMLLFETKVLKGEGYSAVAISTIAGVSTSTPAAVAAAIPELQPYVTSATAIILTGVVITSILSPFLAGRIAAKRGETF